MYAQPSIIETYHPFPRQAEFHANPAKYRLYGGAAGPGKTAALLWEAVHQCWDVPGATCLLLRRTLQELEDSLIKEFRKSVPWEAMGAKYNDQKHRVFWPNKSVLRFGYCQGENDVYQYQGGEYLFIGLDELTHFTLKQWQYLTSRNRHPGHFACMAGATNPGNIGHQWVKALWIDKKPPIGFEEPEKYDPGDYDFIRAFISDNPVYANDKDYHKTLDALGPKLRNALLNGLWDQFIGQYFENFDHNRHVGKRQGSDILCEADGKVYRIEPWWPKWASMDWGFAHEFSVHWHTTAPDGRHITYREWVDKKTTPRMLGEGIVERSVDSEERTERIQQFFLSPDAFADRTGQSTIAEQIRDVACRGNRFPDPAQASDDRVGGWQLLYQLLEADQWLIAENCSRLIDCLPTLTRDEKKPEDIKKIEGDDTADDVRYGLYSRLGTIRAPVTIRAAEVVKDVTDQTARAAILDKFYLEEKNRNQPVSLPGRHGGKRRWRPGG